MDVVVDEAVGHPTKKLILSIAAATEIKQGKRCELKQDTLLIEGFKYGLTPCLFEKSIIWKLASKFAYFQMVLCLDNNKMLVEKYCIQNFFAQGLTFF